MLSSTPTRFFRIARFAIAVAGITLLGFAARESVLRGLEDWRTMPGRKEIRMWNEGRAEPSTEQWQRAVDALREALRLAPHDAELWEVLGLAYEVASRKFVLPGSWLVYAEFALIHYRQAAALRPTSPYVWAGVAVMKYRLGQVDPEFGQALASAMRLGPWEPGVQIIASHLGIALWDRLDPALKGQIRENWRRTAVRQADRLAKLALSHGRSGILCEEAIEALKIRLKC